MSGTVYEEDGDPLIGCSVTCVEDGKTKGTSTDLDGKWKLEVKPGTVLSFSYVGCETKKVKVTEKGDFIKVTLK